MEFPIINSREDLDAFTGTAAHDAFMASLAGTLWRLERDDVAQTWRAVECNTGIERFGFTRADFPDAAAPELPIYIPLPAKTKDERIADVLKSVNAADEWQIQGAGGQALTAMSSIGYGQRWQNVTRVTGTPYYTTKPRKIRVVGNTTSGAAGQVTITFSNGTIFSLAYASGTTTNAYAGETTIPANESYTIGEVNISNRSTYEMF